MNDPKDLITARITQELLDTPSKKEKAMMDLQALLVTPGWIFIERVLKIHIESIEQVILNDDELDPAKEKEMKQERMYCKLFKDIPSSMVQEFMQKDVENIHNDDPYS